MTDKIEEIREALSKYLMNEFQPSDNPAELLQQFGIIKEFQRKAPEWLSYLLTELDAAKQENERLKQENQDLADKYNDSVYGLESLVESLQQRLKQVEEALEWYANDEQYGRIRIIPPIPDIPILHDCGEIAKNTLSLIKGD